MVPVYYDEQTYCKIYAKLSKLSTVLYLLLVASKRVETFWKLLMFAKILNILKTFESF